MSRNKLIQATFFLANISCLVWPHNIAELLVALPLVLFRSGLTTMQNSGNVGERFQQHLTVNLQKTLTAGIILMELSLHGQYFFLKMFVFDCLHTLGINPNQQVMFF